MEALLPPLLYVVNHPAEFIGFAMPLVVDYVNKDVHSKRERFIVSMIATILVTLLLNWQKLIYDTPADFGWSLALIMAESQITYKFYFKNSWVREQWQEKVVKPDVAPTTKPTEPTEQAIG